jgi:DNA-binding transcriptional LysR family regulator
MTTKNVKNKLITAENSRDFDWNKSKLFYHVAKCGGFVKAAKVAGIGQGSLTRQIRILENQVGEPLLIRKPGGTVLTRRGEEFLEEIAPFFLKMKGFWGPAAYKEVNGGEKKRKIRIATTYALAAYVISDLILDYTKENPHICFELIADDHLIDIIVNDVDIAILHLDPTVKGKKMKGIHYEYLFSIQKKLYASAEYINTYGYPQKVEELANHHIISFLQPEAHPFYGDINWVLTLGMPEGELHNPIYISNSIESLIQAAEKGIGIIASYEEFKIIQNSKLVNVLPTIKDKQLKEYFIYPDYLKGDKTIMGIKNYLEGRLNGLKSQH